MEKYTGRQRKNVEKLSIEKLGVKKLSVENLNIENFYPFFFSKGYDFIGEAK